MLRFAQDKIGFAELSFAFGEVEEIFHRDEKYFI